MRKSTVRCRTRRAADSLMRIASQSVQDCEVSAWDTLYKSRLHTQFVEDGVAHQSSLLKIVLVNVYCFGPRFLVSSCNILLAVCSVYTHTLRVCEIWASVRLRLVWKSLSLFTQDDVLFVGCIPCTYSKVGRHSHSFLNEKLPLILWELIASSAVKCVLNTNTNGNLFSSKSTCCFVFQRLLCVCLYMVCIDDEQCTFIVYSYSCQERLPAEFKHINEAVEKKTNVIPLVTASERGKAQRKVGGGESCHRGAAVYVCYRSSEYCF